MRSFTSVLVPLLLLSSVAPASSLRERLQSLARPDIKLPAKLVKKKKVRLKSEALPESTINSCIESLCGPAKYNSAAADAVSNRVLESVALAELRKTVLEPAMARLQTQETELAIARNTRLEKVIADRVPLDPTHPMRPLTNLALLMSQLAKDYESLVTYEMYLDGYVLFQADRERIGAYFEAHQDLGSPTLITAVLDRALLPILNAGFVKQMLFMKDLSDLEARLYALYPGEERGQALIRDATGLLRSIEFLTRETALVQMMAIDDFDVVTIAKAARGEALLPGEPEIYVRAAGVLGLLDLALRSNVTEELRAMPLRTSAEAIAALYDSAKRRSLSDRDLRLAAETQATIAGSCSAKLAQVEAVQVSGLLLRKTGEMLGELKTSAKNVAARLATGPALDSLRAAIDSTEFVLPRTSRQEGERLVSALREAARQNDLRLRALRTGGKDVDQALLYTELMGGGEKSRSESATALVDLCESFQLGTLNDATFIGRDKIQLSWYTVADLRIGTSIAAHEMGHQVAYVLRNLADAANTAGYYSSLNCVANRHPMQTTPLALTGLQSSTYSEEDWADHFAVLVDREMKSRDVFWSRYTRNIGCALITDLGPLYIGNTLIAEDGDSHSSGFFRLLMNAQDQGQMTAACAPVMKDINAAGKGLRCE